MTHTTKHTPGPWAVEPRQWDHGASLAIVAPHNGYIVAIIPFDEDIQVVDEPDGDTVRRHPDELPNAAMLAAAPVMYALIQDMREAFYVKGTRKALLAVMERSKEILAQADGKQKVS